MAAITGNEDRADVPSPSRGCPAGADHDREVPEIDLLSPLTIRGVTFRNRIVMSPMCQYSAEEGLANDWHLVHLGSRAVGGVALVVVEATAVTRDGRISPGDMGIWGDQHVEPLARIARFVHSQGAVAGIQLAHAGRKASCEPPWLGGASLKTAEGGGWTVVGPSPLPFNDGDPVPVELDEAGDRRGRGRLRGRRQPGARRRVPGHRDPRGPRLSAARVPVAAQQPPDGPVRREPGEPHAAAAAGCRAASAGPCPTSCRCSCGSRRPTGRTAAGTSSSRSSFARRAKDLGVDLIDVSSGALVPKARIPVGKGYQVPLARRIRRRGGDQDGGGRA